MCERLLLLDSDFRVTSASRSYYEGFNTSPEQTLDRYLTELGDGQWNNPALLKLLARLEPPDGTFSDFEIQHVFPELGHRTMLLSAQARTRRLCRDRGDSTWH